MNKLTLEQWNNYSIQQKTIYAWYKCREHLLKLEPITTILNGKPAFPEWVVNGYEDYKVWDKKSNRSSDWRSLIKYLIIHEE